jgi:hypothetical protein
MATNDRDVTTTAGDRRAANLFDLRRIIGGLFIVYGLILLGLGIAPSKADIRHASGVHINLWTGLGMLVVGALFLLWAFTRPLGEQLEEAESDEASGGPRRDGNGPRGRGDAGPE